MKLQVKTKSGLSDLNLEERFFLAEGGEGKVYARGSTVYKIYLDPAKMIPLGKIGELQGISKPNILAPKDVLFQGQMPVGFTMDWVKDSIPMCKLFTNDFRTRFGVTQDQVVALVEHMARDIDYIHSKKCLMVDGNEMNYLVDPTFKTPYFIDVDSWQTPSHPATAIMASIKDHHTRGFNEGSDWFGFAVVALQLLIGIHPYKGRHPNFKLGDMVGRMQANASVFGKDVSLPAAVRPFDMIPTAYREWFMRVFERGERLEPPTIAGSFVKAVRIHVPTEHGKTFVLTLHATFSDLIVRWTNGHVITGSYKPLDTEAVHTNFGNSVLVFIQDQQLVLNGPMDRNIPCQIAAESKMVVGNSIFVKFEDKIMEVEVQELGSKEVPTLRSAYSVMPYSTQLWNGMVTMNALGKTILMVPYKTKQGQSAMYQAPCPELDGWQILEAKHEGGVAILTATQNGQYSNFVLKFETNFAKHLVISREDGVSPHAPNFVTLPNGTCIQITEEDEVRIFSAAIGKDKVTVLKDPAVTFEDKLYHDGLKVLIKRGKELYHLETRKGA